MKNLVYKILFVIALVAILVTAFLVAKSAPKLQLPVVESIYNAEHEGVGRMYVIEESDSWYVLEENVSFTFQANLMDSNVSSGYGLPSGVYFLHVQAGPNVGWGIDPRDTKIEMDPVDNGWYKMKVEGENNGHAVLYFYRTYQP